MSVSRKDLLVFLAKQLVKPDLCETDDFREIGITAWDEGVIALFIEQDFGICIDEKAIQDHPIVSDFIDYVINCA